MCLSQPWHLTIKEKHDPITLGYMKGDLGMSKPSMSTAVGKLKDIKFVQKI
jgi:DNA-binding transcriptional regulator GbsR (MarR family)